MTEKKHAILFVDDEINILSSLKRLLRKEGYQLFTTTRAEEAFQILSDNDIHVVVSDQRMPEISGTELLARVKEEYPNILRIILTGYTDVDSITESINKGHIYKFFLKPWNDQNLKIEIRKALEQYELIRTNQALDKNLSHVLKEIEKERDEKSYAMELVHAAFDILPFSAMVVDDQMAVIALSSVLKDKGRIATDKKALPSAHSLFSEEVIEKIDRSMQEKKAISTFDTQVFEKKRAIQIIPLNRSFENKGVLILFED